MWMKSVSVLELAVPKADEAYQFSETRATSNKYLPNWLEWLEEALESLFLIPESI